MTDSILLRRKIDEKGYKLAFVAKAIGLKSRAGLMKKINNETSFTVTEAEKLCELLGISEWDEMKAIFFAKLVDE